MLILVLALPTSLSGCGVVNRIRAKNALNEGARAYKDGRFEEAEKSFRSALELDPDQKNASLFIARAVHQQYKPGVDTPENKEKAERAIQAYKDVLKNDPNNEDSYNAIAYIYRQNRDTEMEEQWLMQRATNNGAKPEKRSDAYMILASKQWECSNNITELKENKETIDRGDKGVIVQYKKPANGDDFNKAIGCVEKGLELVTQALDLNKTNPSAWAYKTNLLRERAKLAQMDKKDTEKADFDRQADDAEKEHKRLNAEANEKKAGEDAKKTPPAAG